MRLESWFSHNLSHHRSVSLTHVLYFILATNLERPNFLIEPSSRRNDKKRELTDSFSQIFSVPLVIDTCWVYLCQTSRTRATGIAYYVCEIEARFGIARLNRTKSWFLLTSDDWRPLHKSPFTYATRLAHARPASKRERAWTGNRHTHRRNAVLYHLYVHPLQSKLFHSFPFFNTKIDLALKINLCYLDIIT